MKDINFYEYGVGRYFPPPPSWNYDLNGPMKLPKHDPLNWFRLKHFTAQSTDNPAVLAEEMYASDMKLHVEDDAEDTISWLRKLREGDDEVDSD